MIAAPSLPHHLFLYVLIGIGLVIVGLAVRRSFKLSLAVAGCFAAVSLFGSLFALHFGPALLGSYALLAASVMLSFACAILLIVGLFQYRMRGLWFAMPLLVAIVPSYYGITSFDRQIVGCVMQNSQPSSTTGTKCE